MANVAAALPADARLLCERCGYILDGLPAAANCPECGRPAAASRGGRRPARFEVRPSALSFVLTTLAIFFRPAKFFGGLSARQTRAGIWFARLHRFLAAALLSAAVAGHMILDARFKQWLRDLFTSPGSPPTYETFIVDLWVTKVYWVDEPVLFSLMLAPLTALIYLGAAAVAHAAAALIEPAAAGRGTRLRRPLVLRGLGFHTVHWLPVCFVAAATVCGYIALIDANYFAATPAVLAWRGWPHWNVYKFVLAAEALLGISYLVLTAWIALRKLAYANDNAAAA